MEPLFYVSNISQKREVFFKRSFERYKDKEYFDNNKLLL